MPYEEALGWLKVNAPMEVQRAIQNENLRTLSLELRNQSLVVACARWREEKNKAWRAAMKWKGQR